MRYDTPPFIRPSDVYISKADVALAIPPTMEIDSFRPLTSGETYLAVSQDGRATLRIAGPTSVKTWTPRFVLRIKSPIPDWWE